MTSDDGPRASDSGSRIPDPGSRNGERGTRNGERETRDAERAAAFAPGTVSNVGCGFDVLGFALEQPGDVVVAIPREQIGVEIVDITGDSGRLPRDPIRNTASVAATALLRSCLRTTPGVGLIIQKGLPLASGI